MSAKEMVKQKVKEEAVSEVRDEVADAQPMDPALEREMNAYVGGLMKMLHSKETAPKVVEMLKSGPPEKTIPATALMVNEQMERGVTSQGKKPSLDVLLAAGVYLTQDLMEIGNAAGIFQMDEADVQPILTEVLQGYIEKGLADGSLDPIELQQKVEPLMDEEHRAAGMAGAEATGIPGAPNEMTAMEQYARKREAAGMKKGMMKGGR